MSFTGRPGKSPSRSQRRTLKECLLIPKYFCAVYDYAGKADLSKAYWNPKRKLGVTMHFSEIIKQ